MLEALPRSVTGNGSGRLSLDGGRVGNDGFEVRVFQKILRMIEFNACPIHACFQACMGASGRMPLGDVGFLTSEGASVVAGVEMSEEVDTDVREEGGLGLPFASSQVDCEFWLLAFWDISCLLRWTGRKSMSRHHWLRVAVVLFVVVVAVVGAVRHGLLLTWYIFLQSNFAGGTSQLCPLQ